MVKRDEFGNIHYIPIGSMDIMYDPEFADPNKIYVIKKAKEYDDGLEEEERKFLDQLYYVVGWGNFIMRWDGETSGSDVVLQIGLGEI